MDISLIMELIQMSYWLVFLLAASATVYFIVGHGAATATSKGVVISAAMVSLITAFQYFDIRGMVGFEGDFVFPTEYRFIGWIIIFPMLVLMAQKFIGMKRTTEVKRVAIVTFIMVLAACLTECMGYGWTGFWVTLIAWAYVAYTINGTFNGKGFDSHKKVLVLGFAVLPLSALMNSMGMDADMMTYREALFILVDVFVVLGFSHCLVTANRK